MFYKITGIIFILPLFIYGCKKGEYADTLFFSGPEYELIADYNFHGLDKVVEWDPFPDNLTSSVKAKKLNGALKISYDVYSDDYVQNGVTVGLGNLNLGEYSRIHFIIKGDSVAGYPGIIDLELLSENRKLNTIALSGITGQWKKFSVPLKRFGSVTDLKKAVGLRFVFCSQKTKPSIGIIYVDRIFLERKELGP